jgi:hypothetical protein
MYLGGKTYMFGTLRCIDWYWYNGTVIKYLSTLKNVRYNTIKE